MGTCAFTHLGFFLQPVSQIAVCYGKCPMLGIEPAQGPLLHSWIVLDIMNYIMSYPYNLNQTTVSRVCYSQSATVS